MEETYKKNKGNAGQKGVQFQLHLVTVCLLNALRNHRNWKISSENAVAGKYDDIVIELDLETAFLIQAKHKENRKITKDQFLSGNSKNADFSLPKYFFSYEEIKNRFQARTVIICTNTTINTKDLEDILTREPVQPDSLLYHESDCFFYKFNENILLDLKKSAENYHDNNSRYKGIDNSVITEENLRDFLENLQIFSCYPCEDYLHEIIEQSLSRLNWSSLCCQDVLKKMEDWFQHPKGEYLTEARAKAMLCEIRSDKYCESLKGFNVTFERNHLDIPKSGRVIIVKVNEGYLPQILKVYCALQIDKRRKLFVNPDDAVEVQKQVVEAFGLRRYKFLIMAWAAIEDEIEKREMIITLRTILNRNKYKTVILLANSSSELARQFGVGNISQIDGSQTLQDLSKESQERLLKTKNVLFQGERVAFGELLHTQTAESDTMSLVHSGMLEKLIRRKEIKVGVPLLDFDEDMARCYISRKFQTQIDATGDTPNILEENLYDAKEKMIVISDSAGMGKTTVLIKMAVSIKKHNSGLWVIKVNLNDYTQVLREFVKMNKKAINAAELLNSLEATKMTNEFEKLVFSISGKVVLMLDGVDEVSPDYTHLVLSLLRHCQEAPNFAKIFVTTRPHVNLQLGEVGLYQMAPFTRLEQIDFLTGYWIHNLHLSQESKEKCSQYAEMLIDRISSWTKSSHYGQNTFTDVPLQVRMLAKIFQENVKGQESTRWEGCKEYLEGDETDPKLPEKFNIARLYDLFLEKKRDVFVGKGSPSGSATATPALHTQFESCLAYHRSLAVNTILPEYKQLFKTHVAENKDTEEYILKIGIVQRLGDQVHFIHRTFAEYFVANCIVEELKLQNPEARFQALLIDEIFIANEFKIIRAFLDILLQEVSLPPNIFKQYQSLKFEESNTNLIFELVQEGHISIFQLILESIHFKVIEGREITVTDWRLTVPFRKRNTLNDLEVLVRQAGVNIKCNSKSLLYLAVEKQQLDMVKFLLAQGADVNISNWNNRTALHLAAYSNNYNIAKCLIEHGADVNLKDGRGFTALHRAAEFGAFDTVVCLVQHDADVNMRNIANDTALHVAAFQRNCNIVEYLVNHGADVNLKGHCGFTALHLGVEVGAFDIVVCLVQHDADVNMKNSYNDTALNMAAFQGNYNIVEYLVQHGADINLKGITLKTALDTAAAQRNWNIVKYLVDHGADVNDGDEEGLTALHLAVKFNEMSIIECLLKHGVDINKKNSENDTALDIAIYHENWNVVKCLEEQGAGDSSTLSTLHLAVKFNKMEIVEDLLQHGVDVNMKNGKNNTALHVASYNENWNIVKCLVEHGADVNAEGDEGLTALHVAVQLNEMEMVEYLVQHGVDVNRKNSKNTMALHMATYNGNQNIVKYLVEHGADVNSKDDKGITVLHFAVFFNEMEIVEYLLQHGVDANMKNSKNNTALHMATYNGNRNIVKCLVEYGADVNAGDAEGLTALHVAAEFNEIKIVEYLLNHGANINLQNSKSSTALHMASYNKNWDVVKCLVEHGVDVTAEDEEGRTALNIAVKFNKPEIVEYLLKRGADINMKNSKYNTT